MNAKVITILFLTLILATTCFAIPTITSISSGTPSGTYKAGDVIQIQLIFSEDVNISGTLALTMNTGGSATFLNATTSAMDFNYTVLAGQNTTNLKAYNLIGSVISALDGNAADLSISSTPNIADGIVIDTNAPVCVITSPTTTDVNTTSVNFTFTCDGASSTLAKIDSNVITSGTSLSTYLIANTVQTITLDANDSIGNMMTQISTTVLYDTNAPTSGSIYANSTWTNDDTPQFTISATHHSGTIGMKMAFSCTNASADTNWTSWVNYATSYSDFNITKSTYGCSLTDTNKTIYIKFKDAAGNIDASRYSATQLYDITAPSAPTGLSTSAGNSNTTLSWTSPSTDNGSGNDSLKIYMKTGSGSYSLKTTLSDENLTTYQITSLTNGTQYCFKMTTVDKAGNESIYSNEECATPASATASISIERNGSTSNIDYAKNRDVITISCTYSNSVNGAKIVARAYSPTSSESTLEDTSSSVSTLDYDYTINFSNPQDNIVFWCAATNTSNSTTKTIYIDNTAPTISWVDSNNTFIGVKKVIVKASDDKYFDKVEFDFNKVLYVALKDTNNNYYFDLNSAKYENGDYSLKATAYDKAGNKTEITKTITALNTLSPKEKAQKAFDQAVAEQKKANEILAYFDREGLIVPTELLSKKSQADTLITEAKPQITSAPETALTKATSALILLQEFNKKAVVETVDTKNYYYDSNNLTPQLKEAGISESNMQTIITAITGSEAERKIVILKAGAEDMRQAKVTITFTNDTNSDIVKIVEIIPKEFVTSAKKIISDANFRIVKDDPVIEFTINAPKGTKASFSYGIGEITTAQATAMIDNNVIQKFSAPPVLISTTSKAEEIVQDNTLILIALIVGAVLFIIIILIIIAILFIIKFAHPGHGFGEGKTIVEHLTPEQEAEKKKWEANK
ncbi:MAG: fibronectin type III domain-containing protein [archaeon]|jgi:hypothetical protein